MRVQNEYSMVLFVASVNKNLTAERLAWERRSRGALSGSSEAFSPSRRCSGYALVKLMDSRTHLPTLVLLAATLTACGQQMANHPTAEPIADTQSQREGPESTGVDEGTVTTSAGPERDVAEGSDEKTEAPSDVASEAADPSASVEPPEDASIRRLSEICANIEARAKAKCTSQVFDMYQSSCKYYKSRRGTCTEEARLTFECQNQASDGIFCAHGVAPNCAQVNSDLNVCRGGNATPDQTAPEDDHTLPVGWQMIEDSELGFTVAMPPGAALDPESKRRTWKAEEGGITYYVAEVAPPRGELGNRTYVRTVVSYVGTRCQRKLRLRGELELKGTTVIQYHSGCPDGTEWDGMLHFWNGKVVSTGSRAAAGTTGVREPFFYSFSVSQ